MKLDGLNQPPHCTTLMGVIQGALEYYGSKFSSAKVYGGSGNAFVINIHDQMCPSSPYCWNHEGLYSLVRNLGLEVRDLGFFHAGSDPQEREGVERQLKEELGDSRPCSLCSMDHQLIYGYDEKQLFTAQPWPNNPDYPPGTLAYGSWSEFGDEIHVNFFTYSKRECKDDRTILVESLAYAVDLHRSPEKHTEAPYGVGPKAYANWLAALDEFGDSHGHWWNATVWSECRRRAGEYLQEASAIVPSQRVELNEIGEQYAAIGDLLGKAADKDMAVEDKRPLLEEARDLESEAIDGIEAQLSAM